MYINYISFSKKFTFYYKSDLIKKKKKAYSKSDKIAILDAVCNVQKKHKIHRRLRKSTDNTPLQRRIVGCLITTHDFSSCLRFFPKYQQRRLRHRS